MVELCLATFGIPYCPPLPLSLVKAGRGQALKGIYGSRSFGYFLFLVADSVCLDKPQWLIIEGIFDASFSHFLFADSIRSLLNYLFVTLVK